MSNLYQFMEVFHIVVVDTSALRRAGLVQIISNCSIEEGFSFEAAEVQSPQDLVEQPGLFDLVLLSVGGEAACAPETLSTIASLSDQVRGAPVVVLSDRETAADVAAALRAGARGYITGCIDPRVMLRTLRFIIGGGVVFPPQVLLDGRVGGTGEAAPGGIMGAGLAKNGSIEGAALTQRENDVLQQLRCGRSNKMIGLHLRLSEATVKVHVRTIMRKLGVSNRTQAALCARNLEAGSAAASSIPNEMVVNSTSARSPGEFMPAA